VQCNAKVLEDDKNLNLIEELKTESAGIFNFLMRGAVDLMRQDGHIVVAESIKAAVAQQRVIMDPHREFLKRELVATEDHNMAVPSLELLYPTYRGWMRKWGYTGVLTWPRLRMLMKEVYPHVKSVQRRFPDVGKCHGWSGIYLVDEPQGVVMPADEKRRKAAKRRRDSSRVKAEQVAAGLLRNDGRSIVIAGDATAGDAVKNDVREIRAEFQKQMKAEREVDKPGVDSDIGAVFREAGIEEHRPAADGIGEGAADV